MQKKCIQRHLIEADISNDIFSDECYVKLLEGRHLTLNKVGSRYRKGTTKRLENINHVMG